MDEKELINFFQKFLNNQYSEHDHELFINYIKSLPVNELEVLLEKYGDYFQKLPGSLADLEQNAELSKKIEAKLDTLDHVTRPSAIYLPFTIKRMIAAAVILVVLSFGLYTLNKIDNNHSKNKIAANSTIIPGGNKAVLTLANGSKIILDSAKNGVLSNQGNSFIKKVKDGELTYHPTKNRTDNQIQYNTITTPRGGQYMVLLPDGSKVWLNAATTLKFPTSFTGNMRKVELTGEAYFEVAKNKAMPFQVALNNMKIEVLGTHFNIMSYPDEHCTKTTLLEGSVRVLKGLQQEILAPGEQADVENNIKVLKVNAEQQIEWKNGNFNFSHEGIRSIMRKISRWYNVDVEYQGVVTDEGFVGTIPRSENITGVLNLLELTKLVHFKIEERRIIVMK